MSAVPPVAAANQPSKLYPASVGAPGRVTVVPSPRVTGATALPPSVSKVRVSSWMLAMAAPLYSVTHS